MFTAARSCRKNDSSAAAGASSARICPPIREAPTMPTGPFWSRCSPRNTEPNRPGTREGSWTSASPVRPTMSPICTKTAPRLCRA